MTSADLEPGVVIRYPYLWARQATHGETEGRKSRPTAVGFRLARNGQDILLLFAITTSQPSVDRRFVEVPRTERLRAGLDVDVRQWIMLDEANVDAAEGSFYLKRDAVLGRFSRSFFVPAMRIISAQIQEIEKISRR